MEEGQGIGTGLWHWCAGSQRAGEALGALSAPACTKAQGWGGQCGSALHNGKGDGSLPSSAVKGNDHIKKGNPLNINTRINLHIIQNAGDLAHRHCFPAHSGPCCLMKRSGRCLWKLLEDFEVGILSYNY